MYYYGIGQERNHKTAFLWYRKAAVLGNKQAQIIASLMHFNGVGVDANRVEAYAWLLLASKNSRPFLLGIEDARLISSLRYPNDIDAEQIRKHALSIVASKDPVADVMDSMAEKLTKEQKKAAVQRVLKGVRVPE